MVARAHGLVIAIAALIFSLLGLVPSASALAVPSPSVPVSAYDSHHQIAVRTYATTERGPPTTYDRARTDDAVDRWSNGASSRRNIDTAPAILGYDHPAPLVQVASLAPTTRGPSEAAKGESAALDRAGVAAKSADEFVDLASAQRRTHILTGDSTGGGHLWPGLPGKTPFPKHWSSDRVMHEISDVATDPSSIFKIGRGGSTIVTGTRGGVDIKVILRGGQIITGHPTNLPRNPW